MEDIIKLIACDMDGTLFNDKKELPASFKEKMSQLRNRDIIFVASSGRSYPKQKEVFKDYLDEIYFVCDNGALIIYREEIIYKNTMHISQLQDLIKVCENIDGILLIFCGLKGIWHKQSGIEFEQYTSPYYKEYNLIKDYEDIDDEILKVSICDIKKASDNSYRIISPILNDKYTITVSGQVWTDVMKKGVNKGLAIKNIQEKFNISTSQTMAFGDFYNDVEMLKCAKYSFVMENANDDMKKYGNYIAPSNNDDGVMKMIDKYVIK